mmetsp:Transcript_23748/g.80899  ORF Transcript_23748/g.80899 Transcript_23748/m.80899 type:complete len:234 (+) Transcript_23748:1036-1737(+)
MHLRRVVVRLRERHRHPRPRRLRLHVRRAYPSAEVGAQPLHHVDTLPPPPAVPVRQRRDDALPQLRQRLPRHPPVVGPQRHAHGLCARSRVRGHLRLLQLEPEPVHGGEHVAQHVPAVYGVHLHHRAALLVGRDAHGRPLRRAPRRERVVAVGAGVRAGEREAAPGAARGAAAAVADGGAAAGGGRGGGPREPVRGGVVAPVGHLCWRRLAAEYFLLEVARARRSAPPVAAEE